MYTPVALSLLLVAGGVAGFLSRRGARRVLRPIAALTLADGVLGFYFHLRGIARKPGGWRFPMTNMVMGPPVFAPLLFGISAYLGLIASYLRRRKTRHPAEDIAWIPRAAHEHHWAEALPGEADIKAGNNQSLPGPARGQISESHGPATAFAAFFSGFEAFYSHYKNNFRYKAQWTPVVLSPMLIDRRDCLVAESQGCAHTWLPALSAAAVIDGGVGFFYHARGVLRRPGGRKHLLYNIMYGPPILAPLLFSACGMLGLLPACSGESHEAASRRSAGVLSRILHARAAVALG